MMKGFNDIGIYLKNRLNQSTYHQCTFISPTYEGKNEKRYGMVGILWVFFFGNVLLMSWDQRDLIVLGIDSKITIFSTGPWSWNCGILRVPSVPASAFATCGANRRRMRQQQNPGNVGTSFPLNGAIFGVLPHSDPIFLCFDQVQAPQHAWSPGEWMLQFRECLSRLLDEAG